jgi:tetratricopeptide (TPR) repeat protein
MLGDNEKACQYFSKSLSYDLDPKSDWVIDMVESYGYALLLCERIEEALSFENIYEEFGNDADFLYLMGLIYLHAHQYGKAAAEFLKATAHDTCRTAGTNSFLAWYYIGVIYEGLGQVEQAKLYYGKARGYGPAEERLREVRDGTRL